MPTINSFKTNLQKFVKMESSSGILLGISAILAFLLANSPLSSLYFSAFDTKILGLSLSYWINDGLMAIFFFVIGLEIKKELVLGHLSSPKKAALPIAAALGGMIFPALFYILINPSGPASNGWGIPMATDIAFAVGVLALFGSRIPLVLKVFLLTVAIVDDLGAILVIAFFYTSEIKGAGLGLAAVALGLATLMRFAGVRTYLPYVVTGTVVWVGFLYSGVHATIAGVLLGLMTPTKYPVEKGSLDTFSPLDDLVHKLHPWVSFAIMPIFAFANAGVSLQGMQITEVIMNPISLGIIVGLFIGKPVGIILFSYLSVLTGFAQLPEGLKWKQIISIGFVSGIGFTMSLFISGLAMSSELEVYSKIGIIIASILSGIAGSILLWFNFSAAKE